MTTRIANVRNDVATLGDYRSRALLGDGRAAPESGKTDEELADDPAGTPTETDTPLLPTTTPPLLTDPSPTAFAAAVVASKLPVTPLKMREPYAAPDASWSPPDSELHLTDRTA